MTDDGLFVLRALGSFVLYYAAMLFLWSMGLLMVAYILTVIVRAIRKNLRNRFGFWNSLAAYCSLYNAGFRITHSGIHKDGKNQKDLIDLEIYRFFWNGKVIQEMPDIDCIRGKFNTINDGHVESLN